ncbi:sugar transferase [Bacillus atrophaeus]|uniref:Phosphotransferase involved in extracellular matrix synthesis n=1 Tax=Bacillus atrophaeus (strain 1942) TaxID=720555 RepID=A0ABM5M1A3_BACA1|nr:sugar transferase [Bacillus atrophaeus]AMR61371.1 sugar transferase [Bacillus subtilis subsp. globigii]ADP33932.1 putative phosphotransferase involved in extracellular matrix synthesis [Bacillus atrophaeus 1942]AIK48038.1 bacterial sugar transferase family protein [Bacillus atrophaeus subsp. globigii]EIM10874.1 putative phosphotransferase involved in extracellular matrix synthesis [Bacillus atrophaeus C89]KFK84219.1 bacterial sugar transferase family protein [Bacillus atrophaeus]
MIAKRVFDLTAAILLLCCASLIIVFAMCIIRLKIGSPVFFTQVRPGLNGKPFTLYKFRTMTDERDKEGNLLPDEVRLTKTGKLIRKLSIDELPQLWNVIKGDLSLVGPRPLLMEYLPLYTNKQSRRHEVKPGITGWAQVNGRNAISWEKKFELDVWYVDHRSFFLDLKILFLTMRKVLISEGIHQSDHATSERFRGSGDVSL